MDSQYRRAVAHASAVLPELQDGAPPLSAMCENEVTCSSTQLNSLRICGSYLRTWRLVRSPAQENDSGQAKFFRPNLMVQVFAFLRKPLRNNSLQASVASSLSANFPLQLPITPACHRHDGKLHPSVHLKISPPSNCPRGSEKCGLECVLDGESYACAGPDLAVGKRTSQAAVSSVHLAGTAGSARRGDSRRVRHCWIRRNGPRQIVTEPVELWWTVSSVCASIRARALARPATGTSSPSRAPTSSQCTGWRPVSCTTYRRDRLRFCR